MSIAEIIEEIRIQDHPYIVIERVHAQSLCDEIKRLKNEHAEYRALAKSAGALTSQTIHELLCEIERLKSEFDDYVAAGCSMSKP